MMKDAGYGKSPAEKIAKRDEIVENAMHGAWLSPQVKPLHQHF